LPFSAVVECNGLLFVSGQASTDETGAIVAGTFEEEFRRSVANMEALLLAAGSDLEHIVQVRSYIRDAANVGLYNQLYREVFRAPYPARTTITGCLPPTLHFELECVARLKATKDS
jgi:2-iminobutanoate/2-iminopropanoate deaminase